MVSNAIASADRMLVKPLFVFCALISLIPLPLSKFFTGSLLSLAILSFIGKEFRSDLPIKLARRFVWVSIIASGLALFLAYFQGGSSQEAHLAEYEVLLFPISLAISIFALVKVSRAIGASMTISLAAGPLIIVDLIQRGYQGNLWKYVIGITVTFLALYLLKGHSRAIWYSVFLSLCVVSIVFDTRSLFLLLTLAFVISLFLQRLAGTNTIWKNLVTIGFAGSTYILFFNLALEGWLGEAVKRLTLEQSGGNPFILLFGARPEVQGNINLIASNPFRLIPGESLNSDQVSIIRSSFSFSNRDPYSTYVTNILGFEEFHSVLTNLWFHLGFVGVLYGLFIAVIALRSAIIANKDNGSDLALGLSAEKILLTYLALRVLWDLAFSPMSDMRTWPIYALAFLPLVEKVRHGKS